MSRGHRLDVYPRPLHAMLLGVLACLALLAGGCGEDALPESPTTEPPASLQSDHFRFFSPTSFWNTQLAPNAAVDPSSPRLVRALAAEAAAEQATRRGPWIGTTEYSVPVYTVPADQPEVRVELTSPVHSPALQAAFDRVPLPPDAYPSEGTDGHLVVWQPARGRLWEFWRLRRGGAGAEASWGGAIENVPAAPGVYGRGAWHDAEPWWGASASSLSIAGGLITFADLKAGEIDHALAIGLPEIRAGVYAAPARRSDGKSSDPLALPEGAALRLDPGLDLDSLALPPLTRMIAAAAQRYGIYVRDGAGNIQFFAQDPVTAHRNPYTGPDGYFEGMYPNELLASFPWDRLQVLALDLHPDR